MITEKKQVLTFPRENFDVKKFIARQKQIAKLRRDEKISLDEYISKVYQTEEKRKITDLYYEIKKIVEEHNIPVQVEFTDFNILAFNETQFDLARTVTEECNKMVRGSKDS
jgi:hypothetical protein